MLKSFATPSTIPFFPEKSPIPPSLSLRATHIACFKCALVEYRHSQARSTTTSASLAPSLDFSFPLSGTDAPV